MNNENSIPSPFFDEDKKEGMIPTNPFGVRTVVFTEIEPQSGLFEQIVFSHDSMVRVLTAIQKEMPLCNNHPGDLNHFIVICNDKYKYFCIDIPDSYTDEEIKKMNDEAEEAEEDDHELV